VRATSRAAGAGRSTGRLAGRTSPTAVLMHGPFSPIPAPCAPEHGRLRTAVASCGQASRRFQQHPTSPARRGHHQVGCSVCYGTLGVVAPRRPARAMVKVLLFQLFARQNVVACEQEPVDTAVVSDDAFLVGTREGRRRDLWRPPLARMRTTHVGGVPAHRLGARIRGGRRVHAAAPVLCGRRVDPTPRLQPAAGRVRASRRRGRLCF
jgi:hypothetical protein